MFFACRRVAIGMLSEMANYEIHINEMWEHGLFAKLPSMLADLLPRYRFGQSYSVMYGSGRGTDQVGCGGRASRPPHTWTVTDWHHFAMKLQRCPSIH